MILVGGLVIEGTLVVEAGTRSKTRGWGQPESVDHAAFAIGIAGGANRHLICTSSWHSPTSARVRSRFGMYYWT